MSISELTMIVGGKQLDAGSEVSFSGVSTDSRDLQKGELFIALQGPNFDGNKFVEIAAEKGAVAALVSRKQKAPINQIIVDDTHRSLAVLAAAWRKNFNGPLVGITGSNGKTTVKEMVTAIFSMCGKVLATEGNLNNDIGVPLSVLKLQPGHEYAVIEMGANHPGEIKYTAEIATPDIAVITNAAAAHLAGFGDIEGVMKTKGEIISALSKDGIAILNRDDVFYEEWKALAGDRKTISFGFSEEAMVRAIPESVAFSVSGDHFNSQFSINWSNRSVDIQLKLAGNHNVKNCLAAAAACIAAGCTLEQVRAGLESMLPVKGRMCPSKGLNGATVIDDSYNANPASCSAALDSLSAINEEKWVVLGAFAELGERSDELHRKIGKEMKEKGVNRLFAVGEEARQVVEAFGANGRWFEVQKTLIESLKKSLKKDVVVLVKGSRSQKMERVVEAISGESQLEQEEIEHATLAS